MELAIFTNMVMVSDGEGRVLVQNRVHGSWTGYAFPGGHVERGEAFAVSARREVREETGLDIGELRLRGIKQFPTEEGARYVVFLYTALAVGGTLRGSEEGDVFWVRPEELEPSRLAPYFADLLRCFSTEDRQELCYYEDETGNWVLEEY